MNVYHVKIMSVIAPFYGLAKSKAKIEGICGELNITIETITKDNLPAIAEKMAESCINLGPTTAKKIKENILALAN